MPFEFPVSRTTWNTIDDAVMGGRSSGAMVVEGEHAIFAGEVSLENGGGFASVRSEPVRLDLSEFSGLSLRIRGDGKRYSLRLRTTEAFDGVTYELRFDTRAGEWETIEIHFRDMEPYFRGQHVDGYPPLVPAKIRTLGFMIAGKQQGEFRLEIASITGFPESGEAN